MPLFPQNTIAIIWDFDKTLIPGYMEEPLFRHFGVDGREFWAEVEGLADYYRRAGADFVERDTLYLDHILTYVREGKFPGLSNRMLRELGAEIGFHPGLPGFLDQVQKILDAEPAYAEHSITVEHYIVSSGLRQMILGSAIADRVTDVWACEFADRTPLPGYLDEQQPELLDAGAGERQISHVIYSIDNTSKTRAVFEINKGTNKNAAIDVNSKMASEDRRIPFQNMIYIADGPSDIPVFSIVKRYGGKCFAVYEPHSRAAFEQANRLQEQGRVHSFGEANFEEGSQTHMWIAHSVEATAARIVRDRETAIAARLGEPPKHLD